MKKKLRAFVLFPIILPHIILYFVSGVKIIDEDIAYWAHIALKRRREGNVINLLLLLANYPEFRNLYYIRLGWKKVFCLHLPRLSSLYLCGDSLRCGSLFFEHGFSTIVTARHIGKETWIHQQVTIGYSSTANGYGNPWIGDKCYIGAGAKVLGPVRVGNNVIIGANAVVIRDIPDNTMVAGVPAVPI